MLRILVHTGLHPLSYKLLLGIMPCYVFCAVVFGFMGRLMLGETIEGV